MKTKIRNKSGFIAKLQDIKWNRAVNLIVLQFNKTANHNIPFITEWGIKERQHTVQLVSHNCSGVHNQGPRVFWPQRLNFIDIELKFCIFS